MTLQELAALAPVWGTAPVPAWTWGCFHRRGITYASGLEDAKTRVVWIQGHGLTGDLRVPAWRPDAAGREGLHDFSVEELLLLAAVEGGVADACWSDGLMHWDNWAAFQPYDKWPEPGGLQRVGPCLIEVAPSGVYVEDWRAQAGGAGLLVALRLMFETGLDGLTRPRDGGLLIAGEHALLSLDRRRPLPTHAPAAQQMRAAGDPYAFAELVFDAETSYARAGPPGAYHTVLSTNPFREGSAAPVTDGFHQTSTPQMLRQVIGEGAERIERQWRVDTLIPDSALGLTTTPAKDGAAWLKREGPVLLKGLA
jgi:hypothetical protein